MIFKDIIDISNPIYDRCPYNHAFPEPRIKIKMTHDIDEWHCEHFDYYNHIGTHIDAPFHKLKNGKKIDDYELSSFTGLAYPLDFYHKKPDESIIREDLEKYESSIGVDSILLFCTGWGEKRSNDEEYLYHSPYLSPEAAQWCVEKKVKGVGIDHYSIAGTKPEVVDKTHEILLGSNIWIAEDLFLPKKILNREKWWFIGFPLYIRGGSGAPARAVLLIYSNL